MFDPNSRYYGLPTFAMSASNGGMHWLVKLRTISPTPGVTSWQVTQADRPDLVAYHFYQDAERFWRIADANGVVDPAESYATPGKRIQIPTSS